MRENTYFFILIHDTMFDFKKIYRWKIKQSCILYKNSAYLSIKIYFSGKKGYRYISSLPSWKWTFLGGRCLVCSWTGRSWGPRFSLDNELTRIPLRVARVLLGISLFILPAPISSGPLRHQHQHTCSWSRWKRRAILVRHDVYGVTF